MQLAPCECFRGRLPHRAKQKACSDQDSCHLIEALQRIYERLVHMQKPHQRKHKKDDDRHGEKPQILLQIVPPTFRFWRHKHVKNGGARRCWGSRAALFGGAQPYQAAHAAFPLRLTSIPPNLVGLAGPMIVTRNLTVAYPSVPKRACGSLSGRLGGCKSLNNWAIGPWKAFWPNV